MTEEAAVDSSSRHYDHGQDYQRADDFLIQHYEPENRDGDEKTLR